MWKTNSASKHSEIEARAAIYSQLCISRGAGFSGLLKSALLKLYRQQYNQSGRHRSSDWSSVQPVGRLPPPPRANNDQTTVDHTLDDITVQNLSCDDFGGRGQILGLVLTDYVSKHSSSVWRHIILPPQINIRVPPQLESVMNPMLSTCTEPVASSQPGLNSDSYSSFLSLHTMS